MIASGPGVASPGLFYTRAASGPLFIFLLNGVGLKAVQELMGHSDLKMTMRYPYLSQALSRRLWLCSTNWGGHQMDTKGPKTKRADNPKIANPL